MKKLLMPISMACFVSICTSSPLEGARPSKTKSKVATVKVRLPSSQEISEQESKLIAMVNKVRQKNGLVSLEPWKTLTYHARQHSQNMADGTVDFGHAGFETRANQIQKTAQCYSVGENVAYTYLIDDPLQESLKLWIQSPHHYENILGDYRETGIGIAYDVDGRCYITQLFSKRR